MDFVFAKYSDRGRRRFNEDSVEAKTVPRNARGIRAFLAVADGMGGLAAGDVASRTAVNTFEKYILKSIAAKTPDREDGIDSLVLRAYLDVNGKVLEEGRKSAARQGMGTTLTAALVLSDGTYVIANVGDSRAYLINEHGIAQLTEDHSALAEAIKAGTMSAEEGRGHPYANALTRCIGEEEPLTVDVFPLSRASEGDVLLLCTDGLHKAVTEAEMKDVVLSCPSIAEAAATLSELAGKHGSDDNISLVMMRCGKHRNRPPARHGQVPRPRYRRAVRAAIGLLTAIFLLLLTGIVILFGRRHDQQNASLPRLPERESTRDTSSVPGFGGMNDSLGSSTSSPDSAN